MDPAETTAAPRTASPHPTSPHAVPPRGTPLPSRASSLATYGAFAACVLVWGSTFLAISIGNDSVPPVWAATIRLALAALVLFAIMALTGQRMPRGAELRTALIYGMLVLGVNFALLYWGEQRVPSGITAVIYATLPLSTVVFARALKLEPLNRGKLAGGLVALAGVAAIFSGELGAQVPLSSLFAILTGATLASLGNAVLKRGPRPPAIAANAVGSVVGAVVCGIWSTAAGETHAIPHTAGEWIPILYLTLAGSVVAFVLYAWLIEHWSATRASFITVLVPLVALLLGAAVRGERLGPLSAVGGVLVLVGVMLGFRGK
jgi:drug/metabolite transporter (DMT)-like permease